MIAIVCIMYRYVCIQFILLNFQVLEFDLSGKEIGPGDSLDVTVKDHEKIGRNRLVGKATIPLSQLLNQNSHAFTQVLADGNGRPTTVS